MSESIHLNDGLCAGGAPRMWGRIVRETIPAMHRLLPPGSSVLEVGYGDGLLSCWLAKELGWRLTGLDISQKSHQEAMRHARRLGLESRVAFELVTPELTWQHSGVYDGVYIKTVLYDSQSVEEYAQRLDWVASVMKPGGVLVNFETGRANRFTQLYRRLRKREYSDRCLYTGEVENLYESRFRIVERRYYSGWSQFFAPIPVMFELAVAAESAIARRSSNNCFAVAIVAHSPWSDEHRENEIARNRR